MPAQQNMARFCYLAQGRAQEIDVLARLLDGRHFISLTWDKPREGSLFLPKSSWSEGRRAMCREALTQATHDYIVFMDGDAITTPAELDVFEQTVATLKPAVAVPRVPKTERYAKKMGNRPWVLAYDSDEQFQCFDARILRDHLKGSPYVSAYDTVSWWYPCVLNQKLIRKHYWRSFIQVNGIIVGNDSHGSYPNNFDRHFIHKEVARLGVAVALPLSAGGRFSGTWFDKWSISLDKKIFKLLSMLSSKLYRPFDPDLDKPLLSSELQSMIHLQPR